MERQKGLIERIPAYQNGQVEIKEDTSVLRGQISSLTIEGMQLTICFHWLAKQAKELWLIQDNASREIDLSKFVETRICDDRLLLTLAGVTGNGPRFTFFKADDVGIVESDDLIEAEPPTK